MPKRKPRSSGGQAKRVRKPATRAEYFAQPERLQATQLKAAHVIAEMRAGKLSLRQASREQRISPKTVLRHARGALRKTSRGTYAARGSDKLLRVLVLPTPSGLGDIATTDSRAATIVAGYWNAVNHFLETGDQSDLTRYAGISITDASGNPVPLLTDPADLERLGAAGVLSFQSLYARTN